MNHIRNIRTYTFVILSMFLHLSLKSQVYLDTINRFHINTYLKSENNAITPAKQKSLSFLSFYQKNLSQQLYSECVFYPSCSQFSKDCFKHYGFAKAFWLTADRLTRCNNKKAMSAPVYLYQPSTQKISDSFKEYR